MTKIFLMTAIGALIVLLVWHFAAHAHDHSRPELNSWFESLKSAKGPCCSDADGSALSDADWEVRDGHYRVRIKSQWWDVPDEAVIKEPNRAGRTMVWRPRRPSRSTVVTAQRQRPCKGRALPSACFQG